MGDDKSCTHLNFFWGQVGSDREEVLQYTVAFEHGDGPVVHGHPRAFDDNWNSEVGLTDFVGGDVVIGSREPVRYGTKVLTPGEFSHVKGQFEGHYTGRKVGINLL